MRAMLSINEIRRLRFAALVESLEGGQAEMARKTDYAASYVWQLLQGADNGGRIIGNKTARRIEQRLGLPENALDQPLEPDAYVTVRAPTTTPGEDVEVRFWPRAKASAGLGVENAEDQPTLGLKFRAESLRRKGINAETAMVIYADGDSMEPVISHGASILFDTSRVDIRDGHLYVLDIDGATYVKRLMRRPGGRLLVRSENPSYPDYEVTIGQDGFRVVGEVMWMATWL